MQISFKELTLQNFYSYGKEQKIDFHNFKSDIVLIDGIDKDTEGSKIGSGKSTIFAGITYVLFGKTLSAIKSNDVVNYIKGKNCKVTLTMQVADKLVKIERGRFPKVFNVYSYDKDLVETNLTKADDKDNDIMIVKMIGIDYDTFLQTVLFSVSNHKQFLSLKPTEQKRIFESIFKFDEVNEVIEEAKEENKLYADKIKELEHINSQIEIANLQITNQITRLTNKSIDFENEKKKKNKLIQEDINFYTMIDVTEEQEKHLFLDEMENIKNNLRSDMNDLKLKSKDINFEIEKMELEIKNNMIEFEQETVKFDSLKSNICPMCKQSWQDEISINNTQQKIEKLKKDIEIKQNMLEQKKEQSEKILIDITEKRENIFEIRTAIDSIECNLDSKEINNLEIILDNLHKELKAVNNEENYYIEEIENNKKLIRQLDYTEIDKYQNLFSISKLFIDIAKDSNTRGSFLRKFIKQMNEIFRKFKLMIPDYNIHIQFNKDFSVRLMKLGKEVPAGSLSNGEKRIGEIMIMLALMKIFKLKNNVLFDMMFMDEVLDSAINGTLLEVVYKFIEEFGKDEKIKIFLISHREEIKNKIDEMIYVTKSSGISTLEVKSSSGQ